MLLCAVFWAAWVSVGLVWGGESQPSVILQLKNGDRLSGIVVSEANGRIQLTNDLVGIVTLDVKEVTNRVVRAVVTATNAPTPLVPNGAKPILAMTTNAPPKPAPPKRWNFDVQVGVDVGFGETERQLYNARFRANYAKDSFHNLADFSTVYGKARAQQTGATSVKSADRMDFLNKTDYEIGHRFFLYNLGGAGYDAIRKLNLHYEVGPGIGYHLLRLKDFKLNTELGGNYQVNQFAGGSESESFFYRLAEDAVWQATPKLSFDQRFEFFPGITDMEKYRLRFEGNMRYALRSNLYLNLTAADLYDNHPAQSVTKNDLQLRSSIGIKF